MANYRQIARRKARKYGVPEAVFVRQIKQESGFNPRARSPAGATGIAQIMPATARGWGINPNDPVASLDAAAKNMSRYIRQFGSVEKALRAYNAGPGNIERSRSFGETNNYVKTILGGLNESQRRSRGGRTGSVGSVSTGGLVPGKSTLRDQVSFDERSFEQALKRSRLAAILQTSGQRGQYKSLFDTGVLSTEAPDPAQFTKTRLVGKVTPGRVIPGKLTPGSPGGGSVGRGKGKLLEMFHDPGINADNGRRTKAIGGHGSHVHVAIDSPAGLRQARKLAENMGLTITSTTGGKHAPGSFHYAGKAIDVGGDPRKLRRFNRRIARMYGVR